jgi:hypothetical protein
MRNSARPLRTQAGKTTFLNCLASSIPGGDRVVSAEEVFELQFNRPDWVPMQTRQSDSRARGRSSCATWSRKRRGCAQQAHRGCGSRRGVPRPVTRAHAGLPGMCTPTVRVRPWSRCAPCRCWGEQGQGECNARLEEGCKQQPRTSSTARTRFEPCPVYSPKTTAKVLQRGQMASRRWRPIDALATRSCRSERNASKEITLCREEDAPHPESRGRRFKSCPRYKGSPGQPQVDLDFFFGSPAETGVSTVGSGRFGLTRHWSPTYWA